MYFHVFLLEQDITKKRRIDKKLVNLNPNLKLDVENAKKYKIKSIRDNAVYAKKAQGQLPGFYYLIS